jgi:UDPglucose--hexose-1-phosphate uridylyltransferase
MPELRRDPLGGYWVVIAPERSLRPREIQQTAAPRELPFCPFCPGHEASTGPSLLTLSERDGRWGTRVIPNRYPALRVEGQLEGRAEGIYDQLNGVGAHEVIIDSHRHDATMATLSVAEIARSLSAYRARIRDLKRDIRLKHILVFQNRGALAGATLVHPHSQLIALPMVPQQVAGELERSREHYERRGRCLLCDVLRQELATKSRLVYESASVVAFAPYASRVPFEVWVAPKAHDSHFEAADDGLLEHVGRALRDVFGRLAVELAWPAYNMVLHSAPLAAERLPHCHWHIEILPVLSRHTAGFEVGSGYFINATPPEVAAECLRRAELSSLTQGS